MQNKGIAFRRELVANVLVDRRIDEEERKKEEEEEIDRRHWRSQREQQLHSTALQLSLLSLSISLRVIVSESRERERRERERESGSWILRAEREPDETFWARCN